MYLDSPLKNWLSKIPDVIYRNQIGSDVLQVGTFNPEDEPFRRARDVSMNTTHQQRGKYLNSTIPRAPKLGSPCSHNLERVFLPAQPLCMMWSLPGLLTESPRSQLRVQNEAPRPHQCPGKYT
jgi:hypothetical protein